MVYRERIDGFAETGILIPARTELTARTVVASRAEAWIEALSKSYKIPPELGKLTVSHYYPDRKLDLVSGATSGQRPS